MAQGDDDAVHLGEVTKGGIELAGALAGGAIGLVGGPAGSLGGAALGVVATRALKATVSRALTTRERDRAGAALVIATAASDARRQDGEPPRNDGFFDSDGRLRPDAEELLEGMLRLAARAYEERKVPMLGRFYAAVAHDKSVSGADAHLLLRTLGELTYRQLVLVELLAHKDEHERDLVSANEDQVTLGGLDPRTPAYGINAEIGDLVRRGLVDALPDRGWTMNDLHDVGAARFWRIGYGKLRLTDGGEELARLVGIGETVDARERTQLIAELRGRPA